MRILVELVRAIYNKNTRSAKRKMVRDAYKNALRSLKFHGEATLDSFGPEKQAAEILLDKGFLVKFGPDNTRRTTKVSIPPNSSAEKL